MPYSTPLLTVVCTTYNQEQYITETLEGFVAQQCTYPIEVIVHDDASTDGTADIIRSYAERYPALIKPIIQTENQYSKGVDILQEIIRNHTTAKYIALCEGDDYWTDPLKLQKQLDYMEANPDCGLTYTKARIYIEKSKKFGVEIGRDAVSFEKVLRANPIATLTVLMTRDIFLRYCEEIKPPLNEWKMGDYPIWIYIAKTGKMHFMNYVSGVYRILPNSASHSTDTVKEFAFIESKYQITVLFAERYAPEMVPRIESLRSVELLKFACRNYDRAMIKRVRQEMRQIPKKSRSNKLRIISTLSPFPFVVNVLMRVITTLKKYAK